MLFKSAKQEKIGGLENCQIIDDVGFFYLFTELKKTIIEKICSTRTFIASANVIYGIANETLRRLTTYHDFNNRDVTISYLHFLYLE